jgi:hypothetical protein
MIGFIHTLSRAVSLACYHKTFIIALRAVYLDLCRMFSAEYLWQGISALGHLSLSFAIITSHTIGDRASERVRGKIKLILRLIKKRVE